MKNEHISIDTKLFSLSKAQVGAKVQVFNLLSAGLSRRRMLDIGLVPGTIVEVMRKSPLGDPIAYNIRGALIALRKDESDQILVKLIS